MKSMRVLLPSTLLVSLLLSACSPSPELDRSVLAASLAKTIAAEQDHVTVNELSDWLIKDQRDFELVDIRDPMDYDAGHIERARNVPLAGLLADSSLAALPVGRKVVVYSNGTAHAAQAALLLRLVERDAYALLGGFNHWQSYLQDPARAGAAEMDPAQRAQYQAVACYFEGDYVAAAGLAARAAAPVAAQPAGGGDALGLGLDLGLGSDSVRASQPQTPAPAADPLGLGLGLGLGSEEVRDKPVEQKAKRLLIKAEC